MSSSSSESSSSAAPEKQKEREREPDHGGGVELSGRHPPPLDLGAAEAANNTPNAGGAAHSGEMSAPAAPQAAEAGLPVIPETKAAAIAPVPPGHANAAAGAAAAGTPDASGNPPANPPPASAPVSEAAIGVQECEQHGDHDHDVDVKHVAEGNKLVAAADLSKGLSAHEVDAKRAEYGYNETITERESAWLIFGKKFWGVSPWMLELVVIVSGAMQRWVDMGVVLFLLVFNAILAFHEDWKAREAVDALKEKLQLSARVLRESAWKVVPARELVPGDVIRLRMGDLVGADARVVSGSCGVDQSALTGESIILDRPQGSLLFAASLVRRGEVTAVVTATGTATFFGKTTKLMDDSAPKSHIDAVVTSVTQSLLSIVLVAIIVVIIVLLARHDSSGLLDSVSLLLVLLLGAIPVALAVMYTASMALGSAALSQHGVIVTRLSATEDAASMTVLCSDKTGTLTKNEMTVKELILVPDANSSETQVLSMAILASQLANHDPIDIAIFNACKARQNVHKDDDVKTDDDKYKYRELSFVPFDAAIRRTEVVLEVTDKKTGKIVGQLKAMKGAVATLCEVAKTPAAEAMDLNSATEAHGLKGWRSIAVAITDIIPLHGSGNDNGERKDDRSPSPEIDDPFKGVPLKVLGVMGMSDEARPDTADVLKQLSNLGVRVAMLTGDNVKVARAMATEVGLPPNIINLDAEKKRIRESLAAGHHTLPRRPGQMLPSLTVKPKSGNSAEGVEMERKLAHHSAAEHHNQPVVPSPVFGPARTPGTGANGGNSGRLRAHSSVKVTDEMVVEEMRHSVDFLHADGFAQIFPADKHLIVKSLQESGAIVGMTGDGVNDAPALKQAEVGCAVSNATDVAKGAASAVLTAEGLSGIVELIKVGRQIHHRIETWILNKTTRTVGTTGFVVISYLIDGTFVVSAFSMLLMVFLFDFVTITIATDNVVALGKPCKWKVSHLSFAAVIMGIFVCGENFGILYIGREAFDLDSDQSNTTGFQAIMFMSLLTTLSVRERRRFWDSRPGFMMSAVLLIEIIAILIVCSVGIPGLSQVPYYFNFLILGWSAVCVFVINDTVKCLTLTATGVVEDGAHLHAHAHGHGSSRNLAVVPRADSKRGGMVSGVSGASSALPPMHPGAPSALTPSGQTPARTPGNSGGNSGGGAALKHITVAPKTPRASETGAAPASASGNKSEPPRSPHDPVEVVVQ